MSSSIPTVSAAAIIVSFNSEDDLGEALTALPAWLEIVVVDQSPHGYAGEVLEAQGREGVFVRSGANRGFGAGCNLGAANTLAQVLVFVNPDARLDDQSAAELVNAVVDNHGTIVGPTLTDETGAVTTQARNWSRPWHDFVNLLAPARLVPERWSRDIPESDPRYADGGRVPYVQGACFAVGRREFFSAGGFDEEFFLYGEEEHLASEFKARGLETLLVPSSSVLHVGHTSTARVADFATTQLMRSKVLTYRKRSGLPAAWGGATLLSIGIIALLITSSIRPLVGYRPVEDAAWCRAALRGVVAGLFGRRTVPPLQQPSGEHWGGATEPTTSS